MDGQPEPRMREGTLERRQAILRDAVAVIASEHGAGVDIDMIAHRIGTSRRQLQRVFAEMSGASFRGTLAAVRMSRARRLLRESDLAIAEVGRVVGYPVPAQFSKAFRHRHGVSPRQYRNAARSAVAPPAILFADADLPDDRGPGRRVVGPVARARPDR